jgi:tetratricopeptide (TPR) repeat protein
MTDIDANRTNQLRFGYHYSIKAKNWTQAQMWASLLFVESQYSPEVAVLLADAFYMNGQIDRAIDCLAQFMIPADGSPTFSGTAKTSLLSDDGLYLYALCCYAKEKYSEVVAVLYPSGSEAPINRPNSMFTLDRIESVVYGSAGLDLLGRALEKLGDRSAAAECFARCVDLNPMMFEAFSRLSNISFENSKSLIPPNRFAKTHLSDESFAKLPSGDIQGRANSDSPVMSSQPIPPSIMTNTPVKQRVSANPRHAMTPPSISKPPLHPSSRKSAPSSGYTVGQIVQILGAATHALHAFDANVVIDILSKLPPAYQELALVNAMIGKALAEACRFPEAEAAFARALKADPAGVEEYIDVYSSTLWQLRKELELAHLCTHGLRTTNRARSAKLWIAVGNAFSLQKESETAMKFISRAIQIDANFAYAHVLMGHEFYAVDKFDRAKQCYLRALELDPRNYNAYWGLGQIYARQEELANAKYNFIKALEINPKSSTVRYSLATAAMGLRENELAYQQLTLAIELNPNNAPALCQKAMLEMSVFRKPEVAKESLERALAITANEPVVYVLLGKIYAAEGGREKAMRLFNQALELLKGAKDNYGIKQCIEDLDFFASPTEAS